MVLTEALEDWRDLASDRDAADALLHFEQIQEQLKSLQQHLDQLKLEPPQFDNTRLEGVLEQLSSASRLRTQIVEGNDMEVLVPTLRAFLFDEEESMEEKFNTYPALIRYAGYTILAELWGWAHIDLWPIYNQRAHVALERLGWEVPKKDYLAFARAFANLRMIYEQDERVARKLPLNLEIDHFLSWVYETIPPKKKESRRRKTTSQPADLSDLSQLPDEAAPEMTKSVEEALSESLEAEEQFNQRAEEAAPAMPEPQEESQTNEKEKGHLSPSHPLANTPSQKSYAIREFGTVYDPAVIPANVWPDHPLKPPTGQHLAAAEARIRTQLALPADVIRRASTHLLAGRHLILTGAPGTGKSHLCTLLAAKVFGYYPMLVTATAEWSSFDVVGGLVPLASQSGILRVDVRPGVVYEALRRNWLLAIDGNVRHNENGLPLRLSTIQGEREWPGVWLVIDELNRADVDKAFGDLFTALESGLLRVPRAGTEGSSLIPIPKDFRILATLNTRDRHFLFTLSDALKRRFAFVEIDPPSDMAEEYKILLHRAKDALLEQGLQPNEETLRHALDILHPVVQLLRQFHTIGSAPLLACLRYVGAALHIAAPSLDSLLQEAVVAEILPQLEGLRDLSLRLLAHLFHADQNAALDLLANAITSAYGNPFPLRTLHALTNLSAPSLSQQALKLQRATPTEPATMKEALALLDELRSHASAIPAPNWPRVAAQLEIWSEERAG